MLDSQGEELMCKACVNLGGYHAENYKAFDDLCGKAFYEFCMALEGVPEKLTSTHVRENKATAHIKEASKDAIDNFLEHWVSTEFEDYFKEEGTSTLPEMVYVSPTDLHKKFKTYLHNEKEVLDEQSFKSRLARKKLTSMPKKRVRLESTTYQPHMYVVSVRKLILELDLAGATEGVRSFLDEKKGAQEALDSAVAEFRQFEHSMKGKLWTQDNHDTKERLMNEIAERDEKHRKLMESETSRLVAEVVEDESITAGNFVPKAWRDFYDNVEERVAKFLDSLFGPEEGEINEATTSTDSKPIKRKAPLEAECAAIGFTAGPASKRPC